MGTWASALKLKKEIESERKAHHELMHGKPEEQPRPPTEKYPPPPAKGFAGGGMPAMDPETLERLRQVGAVYPEDAAPKEDVDYMSEVAKIAQPKPRKVADVGELDGATEETPEPAAPTYDASPAPTSSKDRVDTVREQLEKYLGKQTDSIDNMQALADLYKQQMGKENNRPDLRGMDALSDYYWGTNFTKVFDPPKKGSEQTEAAMKAQDLVNKERQPVTSDLLKQYGVDNNAVSKEQANYWKNRTANERSVANSVNTGITDEMGAPIILNPKQGQTAQKMHDAMFLGRGSNAQVQQSIGKLRSGVQFENLIAAIPKGEPTPQDMADLTSALGQTVNGTNILTDHRFASLYPGSLPLTAANVAQWVTGNPHGQDQKEWINRMLNEVRAEKAGAQKTVNRWVDSQAEYFKSAGLPPAFVNQASRAAKGFYNEAYEPVAGVGGFTGRPGGAQPPAPNLPADLSPMKDGYRLKQKPDGSQYWLNPQTGKIIPVVK
jgi:hypothetical protein